MRPQPSTITNSRSLNGRETKTGGSIAPADLPDLVSSSKKIKVVFVSYGSRENGAAGKTNVEGRKQAGINSVFYESPLTAHEWLTWRRSLYQFAPLLFRERNPAAAKED